MIPEEHRGGELLFEKEVMKRFKLRVGTRVKNSMENRGSTGIKYGRKMKRKNTIQQPLA
jgi:hypothetical protein